jgi:hypothetical protein
MDEKDEKVYDDNTIHKMLLLIYPENPKEDYDKEQLQFPKYCSVECGDKIDVNSFSECCSQKGMMNYKHYLYDYIELWRARMLKAYIPRNSKERKERIINDMIKTQKQIDEDIDLNKRLFKVKDKNGWEKWVGFNDPRLTVRYTIRFIYNKMIEISNKIKEIVSAPLVRRKQIMGSLDGFSMGFITGNAMSGGGDGELVLIAIGAAIVGGIATAIDESIRGDYLAFIDYVKAFTVLMFRYETYYYSLAKILRYKYMQKQKGINRYAYYSEMGDKNVESGPVGGAGFSMSRRRSRRRSKRRSRRRSKSRSRRRSKSRSRRRSKSRSKSR